MISLEIKAISLCKLYMLQNTYLNWIILDTSELTTISQPSQLGGITLWPDSLKSSQFTAFCFSFILKKKKKKKNHSSAITPFQCIIHKDIYSTYSIRLTSWLYHSDECGCKQRITFFRLQYLIPKKKYLTTLTKWWTTVIRWGFGFSPGMWSFSISHCIFSSHSHLNSKFVEFIQWTVGRWQFLLSLNSYRRTYSERVSESIYHVSPIWVKSERNRKVQGDSAQSRETEHTRWGKSRFITSGSQ